MKIVVIYSAGENFHRFFFDTLSALIKEIKIIKQKYEFLYAKWLSDTSLNSLANQQSQKKKTLQKHISSEVWWPNK